MNWKLGAYDKLVAPQIAPNKMFSTFSAYPQSVYVRHHSNDLSLTATAMPTTGLPLTPTAPRERKPRHFSEPNAIQLLRESEREKFATRRKVSSLSEGGRTLPAIKLRPPSGKVQPFPVLPAISPSTSEEKTSTTTEEQKETVAVVEEDDEIFNSSDSDEMSFTDDDSVDDLPPSTVGFEEQSYNSLTSLIDIEFPAIQSKSNTHPSTLIQEHYLLEHLSQSAGLPSSRLNPRTNNIVRAYDIKGPLDVELFQQATNKVVSLHPILLSSYSQNSNNKFFLHQQTSQATVQLDQSISYEKPSELITLARRKVFDVPIKQVTTSQGNATKYGNEEQFNDKLSLVSYKEELPRPRAVTITEPHPTPPPKILPKLNSFGNEEPEHPPLVKIKLVRRSNQDYLLILSFPRIVSDFWSSCLFIQQLVEAYNKLEKSATYRPPLAVLKQAKKREDALNAIESRRGGGIGLSRPVTQSTSTRLLQRRAILTNGINGPNRTDFKLRNFPKSNFQQVALREHQLLFVRPKEKHWSFWEATVTATIRRLRGPPRTKVISPLRIPAGFGEVTRRAARPVTSRLRPLTARNRPITARRSIDGYTQESLSGPRTEFETIKVEEIVGVSILKSFPEEYLTKIDRTEILSMVSLSLYILLLGRCCRGWGGVEGNAPREKDHNEFQSTPSDPLLKYQQETSDKSSPVVLSKEPAKKRGFKLDVGSFLIGVDVSLRQLAPELTIGLFGPLTNTVGLRVDLSLHTTFADLVLSQWKVLHRCRGNGYFPFHTISDELGLVHGLPIRFSYLYPLDVQQLSNPDEFYFIETSVGVALKALARLGSCCYINPLNTKMDDSCQLELFMWEGVRGDNIDGLLLYQPHLLRSEIVKAFKTELLKLFDVVSQNPTISLAELAAGIKPPFIHSGLRRHRR